MHVNKTHSVNKINENVGGYKACDRKIVCVSGDNIEDNRISQMTNFI